MQSTARIVAKERPRTFRSSAAGRSVGMADHPGANS
jgi:hypothetical protein